MHSQGWGIVASHLCVTTTARKRADVPRIREQRDRSSLRPCKTFQQNLILSGLLWHRMCSRSTLGRGELWAEPGKHQNESPASNFDNLWRFWRLQESLFQGKPERKGPSRGCPLCQAGLAGCREMTVQPAPSSWVRYNTQPNFGDGFCTRSSLPTQDMSTMSNWLMHSRSSIGANVGRQARFAETWNHSSDTICKIKWHSHSSFPCWVLAWRVWPYCPLLFMHQTLILLPDFLTWVVLNDTHTGVCNVCDQIPNERRF